MAGISSTVRHFHVISCLNVWIITALDGHIHVMENGIVQKGRMKLNVLKMYFVQICIIVGIQQRHVYIWETHVMDTVIAHMVMMSYCVN